MLNKIEGMDKKRKVSFAIGASLVLIILMLGFYIFGYNKSSYNSIKEDSTKGFVYTISSSENSSSRLKTPYINISGSFGKSINEEINSYVFDFVDNQNVYLTYAYSINGKVLSLVIKTIDYGADNVPIVGFKSYNINLEDQILLGDEDLLAIYNMSTEKAESIIEKRFMYWYGEVKEKGYINEEECDYECFLRYRDVDGYLDGVAYYIDKGKLVAFKPFIFYSVFGEENYFKKSDYEILLSE